MVRSSTRREEAASREAIEKPIWRHAAASKLVKKPEQKNASLLFSDIIVRL